MKLEDLGIHQQHKVRVLRRGRFRCETCVKTYKVRTRKALRRRVMAGL